MPRIGVFVCHCGETFGRLEAVHSVPTGPHTSRPPARQCPGLRPKTEPLGYPVGTPGEVC